MKKYLIGFCAAIAIVLLCSFSYRLGFTVTDVKCCWVENHKYVIATNYAPNRDMPGGVAIVHAESCPCKR